MHLTKAFHVFTLVALLLISSRGADAGSTAPVSEKEGGSPGKGEVVDLSTLREHLATMDATLKQIETILKILRDQDAGLREQLAAAPPGSESDSRRGPAGP